MEGGRLCVELLATVFVVSFFSDYTRCDNVDNTDPLKFWCFLRRSIAYWSWKYRMSEGERCTVCGEIKSRKRLIQCDGCDQWFHLSCVRLTRIQAETIPVWHCRGVADNGNSIIRDIGAQDFDLISYVVACRRSMQYCLKSPEEQEFPLQIPWQFWFGPFWKIKVLTHGQSYFAFLSMPYVNQRMIRKMEDRNP